MCGRGEGGDGAEGVRGRYRSKSTPVISTNAFHFFEMDFAFLKKIEVF